jgi:hypothetical protein
MPFPFAIIIHHLFAVISLWKFPQRLGLDDGPLVFGIGLGLL